VSRRFARGPTWARDATEVRAPAYRAAAGLFGTVTAVATRTLVLPPQVGHGSSIVDYGRDQSQMMTIRDAGLDQD
jgi:poly(3-hydroxybutyrate) depolymerase